MINVKDLLDKRTQYAILRQQDMWLEEIINSETQEEIFFIALDSFVSSEESKQKKEFLMKFQR